MEIRPEGSESGQLFIDRKIVGRDLYLVAIRIVEVDGVCDPMILELELNASIGEFTLRPREVLGIRPKSQMTHGKNVSIWTRLRIGFTGIPNTAGIDEQRRVTDPLSRAADQIDIDRFAFAHRFPTELDGCVTRFAPSARTRRRGC